jgi:hypothetical protein
MSATCQALETMAIGLFAASAGAQANQRLAGLGAPEPTIKTTTLVDGRQNGTVPAPPADVMGTPSDSTLIASDQLCITKLQGNGVFFNQWAKVDPSKTGTGGLGDRGLDEPEFMTPLLNADIATAAGRFWIREPRVCCRSG